MGGPCESGGGCDGGSGNRPGSASKSPRSARSLEDPVEVARSEKGSDLVY